MSRAEDIAEHIGEELLQLDGFDDAIIGFAERCGQPPLLVYDHSKIIEILVGQGMEYDEALEYYDFNIGGAWVGEGTPLTLYTHPEAGTG